MLKVVRRKGVKSRMEEEALNLIQISKRDLEASKILFEKKFKSQCFWLFFQSVEKYLKGYCVFYKIIKHKEIKKMGHDLKYIITLLHKFYEKKYDLKDYQKIKKEQYEEMKDLELKKSKMIENFNILTKDELCSNLEKNVNKLKEDLGISIEEIDSIKPFKKYLNLLLNMNFSNNSKEEYQKNFLFFFFFFDMSFENVANIRYNENSKELEYFFINFEKLFDLFQKLISGPEKYNI